MMGRFANYPSLAGKVVVITGGATGIGESLVEHFVAQGSRVHFVDIDQAAGDGLVRRLAHVPIPPTFVRCDVVDVRGLQAIIDEHGSRSGGIDVLVNNAANDDRHAAAEVDAGYWRGSLAVNLDHQFFAAQSARKYLIQKGGGSIINLSSIMVQMGASGAVAYVTAKGGILAMTRALAREFGTDRIRVNSISPGWIMTRKQVERYLDAAGEARLVERQCLPAKLVPADVARMALFLAADDSEHCTSQNFIVDGGWV